MNGNEDFSWFFLQIAKFISYERTAFETGGFTTNYDNNYKGDWDYGQFGHVIANAIFKDLS